MTLSPSCKNSQKANQQVEQNFCKSLIIIVTPAQNIFWPQLILTKNSTLNWVIQTHWAVIRNVRTENVGACKNSIFKAPKPQSSLAESWSLVIQLLRKLPTEHRQPIQLFFSLLGRILLHSNYCLSLSQAVFNSEWLPLCNFPAVDSFLSGYEDARAREKKDTSFKGWWSCCLLNL